MNLPSHSIRRLRKILQWSIDGFEITKEEAREGLKILAPAKRSEKAKAYGRAARAKDTRRIAAQKLTKDEIRAAVVTRAGGWCEGCNMASLYPLRWDHWLGGAGRRVPKQTVETTWMLCRDCDSMRTHNRPDAAHWNHLFEMHCRKYGYRFYAHVEHAALSRKGTG